MKRRDVGRILMAAGVFLGIIYTLISMSNTAMPAMRFTNLILYTGIAALASGLIIFGTAGGKR
jgi:xanthosine utilization system XapX-like protein